MKLCRLNIYTYIEIPEWVLCAAAQLSVSLTHSQTYIAPNNKTNFEKHCIIVLARLCVCMSYSAHSLTLKALSLCDYYSLEHHQCTQLTHARIHCLCLAYAFGFCFLALFSLCSGFHSIPFLATSSERKFHTNEYVLMNLNLMHTKAREWMAVN